MMETDDLSKGNNNVIKFEAAFYADLNKLKRLVRSKEDLKLAIPVPKGYYWMWKNQNVYINILDILNWLAFGLYEYCSEKEICHNSYDAKGVQILNDCINPSVVYNDAINCINWICDKFSIKNYDLKDYSSFRPLRHCLLDEEGWLDEDEIKEALQHGYRQIDLDLINASEKCNGELVYALVKQGADYNIDPEDHTDESSIINILGSDLSFQMLPTISYHCRRDKFSFSDSYEMISSLYQVGVSNYILDIAMMND